MWIPPDKTTALTLPWGDIEFGRARYGGGQTTGVAPIMARIQCDGFSSDWFRVRFVEGKTASMAGMVGSLIADEGAVIPPWLEREARRSGNFEYKAV